MGRRRDLFKAAELGADKSSRKKTGDWAINWLMKFNLEKYNAMCISRASALHMSCWVLKRLLLLPPPPLLGKTEKIPKTSPPAWLGGQKKEKGTGRSG